MLKIVILEDNRDRQTVMQDCLSDRFHRYQAVFFDNAPEACDYLRANLASTLVISLDHDLELKAAIDGKLQDPGSGREVADFLAMQTPSCPVIIHSTNTAAGDGMQFVLEESKWETHRVHPYGDLEWIPSKWLRTLRDAVVANAKPR
jgi:CheY-like chemotaxis protein